MHASRSAHQPLEGITSANQRRTPPPLLPLDHPPQSVPMHGVHFQPMNGVLDRPMHGSLEGGMYEVLGRLAYFPRSIESIPQPLLSDETPSKHPLYPYPKCLSSQGWREYRRPHRRRRDATCTDSQPREHPLLLVPRSFTWSHVALRTQWGEALLPLSDGEVHRFARRADQGECAPETGAISSG